MHPGCGEFRLFGRFVDEEHDEDSLSVFDRAMGLGPRSADGRGAGSSAGSQALSGHHYGHQRHYAHGEDRCGTEFIRSMFRQTAALLRIAPGAKDLSAAEKILFSDLAVGDRALVKPDPNAAGATAAGPSRCGHQAIRSGAKQQKDREDWQRRGVGGLVKSVDAASGVIVLTSGAGATAKTITVHTTKTTMLKRYAPASVRFDEALPAPIDAIHAGDQLRARGEKNADGTRDCRGRGGLRQLPQHCRNHHFTRCGRLNAGGQGSGHQEAGHHSHHAEAQMRRLPDRMAQMLAMRLKGTTSGGQGQGQGGWHAKCGGCTWRRRQQGGGQWRRSMERRPGGARSAADAQPRAGHSTWPICKRARR